MAFQCMLLPSLASHTLWLRCSCSNLVHPPLLLEMSEQGKLDVVRHLCSCRLNCRDPLPSRRVILCSSLLAGISDIRTTTALMRFLVGANMLGLPAMSIPVGSVASPSGDPSGKPGLTCPMPVGLQLMAPAWHEASLLHAAAVLEGALGPAARPRPAVFYEVLGARKA